MNIKIRKIISFLLLMIILLTNLSPVFAGSFNEGQKITLEKDHDCISLLKFQGKDMLKGITYVVYRDPATGKTQPAFCVEPNQEGVGTGAGDSYDVTLSLMKDQKLWRVLYKGYMGSKYSDWGLECDDDLYYATKTAVHCLCDGTTPKGKYEIPHRVGRGEDVALEDVQRRGAKVLEVSQQLYDYGVNGTENYISPEIHITKSGAQSVETINGTQYLVQNYILDGNRDITTYNVAISNFPANTLVLNRLNMEANTMSNNTFKIAIPTKNIVANTTGIINIINAQVKTYPIFYAKAYDENVQDYIIYADPVEFTNTSTTLSLDAYKSTLKITKVDDETNSPLSGVTFDLKYADTNEKIGTYTTNSSGIITIGRLRQGKVIATETSTKADYVLDSTPTEATLKYNEVTSIIVGNSHQKGNIKVIKIDKDNNEIKIPNVEFQLLNSNKEVIGTYETNTNGEIYIEGLRTGTYYLHETKEDSLYYPLKEDIAIKVEWNKTTETKIQNEKIKGQLKIIKLDEDYNEIPVEGAEFEIIDSNNQVLDTIITDENGETTTKRLPIGTYRIREISTDENYILDEQNKYVEIKQDTTTNVTLTNKHKLGNLKIFKVDKDNNQITLGGVKFYLYSEEFKKIVGEYTTDVNGEIFIENLRIGNYKLIEASTNKWYDLADDTEIEIEWDTTINTIIENELKKGQIKVIKVDKDNNEIKLEGVKFEVLNENGDVLETITTNKDGETITNKYSVRDFATLTLKEVETQEEYHINSEPVIVSLEAHQVKDVKIENEVKKGQIRVVKVDKDNNGIPLEGVTFDIVDEKNNVVDTITTNEHGEAISIRLPISQKYKIIEVATKDEYVLSDEVKTITLKEDEVTNLTITNEKKKGQLKVIKVDKDNNEVKLEGVTFDILDEQKNVVDTVITDDNGEATTKRLPIDHEYIVVEKETNKEYVLTEETQTVELKENEIKSIKFENEKIKGYVEITKVDSKTKEPLEGATFGIYDENNKEVATVTTDKNGKATSELLPIGKYFLKEINTGSVYYLLNTGTFEFEILKNHETVPLTIDNEPTDIKVDVDKKGTIEIKPGEDVNYEFSNVANNSNVYLENFKWFDYIPTDYIRLQTMTTGTWNQDLDYNVYYKTNKSEDYILFKENLSTKENYSLDFTTIELEEDEYITETCFDFGKVDKGFKESTSPTMICKSLENLQNGEKFTNHTKTIGNYFGVTAEANSKWTTIIHIPEKIVEEKLPRTGK